MRRYRNRTVAPMAEHTLATLREQVLAHNSVAPVGKRITLGHARAAYREACLEYDPDVRPGASRLDWAVHRLTSLSASMIPDSPLIALTAARGGIIIDKLGRRWNPLLHPRGRDGKFIQTGGFVRLFQGTDNNKHYAVGEVLGINPDGSVNVRITGSNQPKIIGQEQRVKPKNIARAKMKARLDRKLNAVHARRDDQRNVQPRLDEAPEMLSDHARQRQIADRPGQRLGKDRNGNDVVVGARVKVRAWGKREELPDGIVFHYAVNALGGKGRYKIRWRDENAEGGINEMHVVPNNVEVISVENLEANLREIDRQIPLEQGRRLAPQRMREDLMPIGDRAQGELRRGDRVRVTQGRHAGREGEVYWINDPNKDDRIRVRFPEGGAKAMMRAAFVERIGDARENQAELVERPDQGTAARLAEADSPEGFARALASNGIEPNGEYQGKVDFGDGQYDVVRGEREGSFLVKRPDGTVLDEFGDPGDAFDSISGDIRTKRADWRNLRRPNEAEMQDLLGRLDDEDAELWDDILTNAAAVPQQENWEEEAARKKIRGVQARLRKDGVPEDVLALLEMRPREDKPVDANGDTIPDDFRPVDDADTYVDNDGYVIYAPRGAKFKMYNPQGEEVRVAGNGWDAMVAARNADRVAFADDAEDDEDFEGGDRDQVDPEVEEIRAKIIAIRDQLPPQPNNYNDLPADEQMRIRAGIALRNAALVQPESPSKRQQLNDFLRHAEGFLARAEDIRPKGNTEWEEVHEIREQLAGMALPPADRAADVPLTQPRQEFPPQAEPVNPDLVREAEGSRPLAEPAEGRVPRAPDPEREPEPLTDGGLADWERELLGLPPMDTEPEAPADPVDRMKEQGHQYFSADKDPADYDEALVWLTGLQVVLGMEPKPKYDPKPGSQYARWDARRRMQTRIQSGMRRLNRGDKDAAMERFNRMLEVNRAGFEPTFPYPNANERLQKVIDLVSRGPLSALFEEIPEPARNDFSANVVAHLGEIVKRAQDGGVTFNPGEAGFPTEGFAVAYPGFELKLRPEEVTEDRVRQYIKEHQKALEANPQFHLGGWKNNEDGLFYFDIVQVIPDREEAERIGRRRGELAIFDLGALEEIDLRAPEDVVEGEPNGGEAEPEPSGDGPSPGGGDVPAVRGPAGRADEGPRADPRALGKAVGNIIRSLRPEGAAPPSPEIQGLIDQIMDLGRAGMDLPDSPDKMAAIGKELSAQGKQQQGRALQRLAGEYARLNQFESSDQEGTPDPLPPESPETPGGGEGGGPEPAPANPVVPDAAIDADALEAIWDILSDALDKDPKAKRVVSRDEGKDAIDKLDRAVETKDPSLGVEALDELFEALVGFDGLFRRAVQQQQGAMQDLVARAGGQESLLPANRGNVVQDRAAQDAELSAIADELQNVIETRIVGYKLTQNIKNAIRALDEAKNAQSDADRDVALVSAERRLVRAKQYDAIRRVIAVSNPEMTPAPTGPSYDELNATFDALIGDADLTSNDGDNRQAALKALVRARAVGDPNNRIFKEAFAKALSFANVSGDKKFARNIDNALRVFYGQEPDRGPGFEMRGGRAVFDPNITPSEQAERALELAGRIKIRGAGPDVHAAADRLRMAAEQEPYERRLALGRAEDYLRRAGRYAEAREVRAMKEMVDVLPEREITPEQQAGLDEFGALAARLRDQAADLDTPAERRTYRQFARWAQEIALLGDIRFSEYNGAINELRRGLGNFPDLVPDLEALIEQIPHREVRGSGDREPSENHLRALEKVRGATYVDAHTVTLPAGSDLVVTRLGGGINPTFRLTDPETGTMFVLKFDSSEKVVHAEHDAASFYRELGFDMPHVSLVNPDSGLKNQRGLLLMDWAGADIGVTNADTVSNKGLGKADLDTWGLQDRSTGFRFLLANGVIRNSDRHSGNLMHGTDTEGNGYLFPIDHGYSMSYANQYDNWAKGEFHPENILNYISSNASRRIAVEYAKEIGKEQALTELTAWAQQMRDAAEAKRDDFAAEYAADFLITRADWLLDQENAQKVIDDLFTVEVGWYG